MHQLLVLFGGKELEEIMCAKSAEKIYKYHVVNLRSIEIALKHIAISGRKAISTKNEKAEESFVRLYAFLLGAWAETRLKKLLYERNGFDDIERDKICNERTQLDQWLKAVEVAFRKHFGIPHAPLSNKTLSFTFFTRYEELKNILNQDLRSIIEIRNKLAHGQWIYPFNSEGNDIDEEKFRRLKEENILHLQFKKELMVQVAQIIHDLVVSLPTFDRDFDIHYKQIIQTRNNLKNRSYLKYRNLMIEKYQRGIEKRRRLRA